MARGTQLLQLIHQFRAEVRQSTQLSVGADSLPHVVQLLRRIQNTLYEAPDNDWAFLRMYPTKNLAAGQRFYDPPANLNIDRIEEVRVIYDSEPIKIDRGISFDDYAIYDPEDDERSSPTLKWDLRWTGTKTQIEVWPIPDSNDMKLMFKCLRPLRPLVSNDDVADLDDTLIVLFAAAEELAANKSRDAEMKLQLAQKHLQSLKSNAQSGSSMIQLGLGPPPGKPSHAVVRVR